jgi:hypothetical protein
MPGFDRTGPAGQGSKTGRRLGKCDSNANKNDDPVVSDELKNELGMRAGRGMGKVFRFGRGKGQGRGLGRGNA